MITPGIEVCFSPVLLKTMSPAPNRNVVVVDILRATTAMCTAFGYGAASIIPVENGKKARERKKGGWLVAGEKEGLKLPFADFGNSPLEFRNDSIKGKELVFSTTNGTRAIQFGSRYGKVHIASFVNLETLCNKLSRDRKDVLILCSGWKDGFSLEDSIFAGAMADLLATAYGFAPQCDATLAAMTLWNQSAHRLIEVVSQSSHYLRLLGIEDRKGLKYCFFPEKFRVVPVLEGEKVVNGV